MKLFLALLFLAVGSGKGEESPICPAEGAHYFPDPLSCAHYYLCSNGQSFHLACGPGTHWNQALLVCDLPENANCGVSTQRPSSTVTEDHPSTPGGTPTTSQQTNTSPVPTTTRRPEDFPCPSPVEFIYMPHPDDCQLFYWCEYGVYGGISNCGTGLWFSFAYQACVNPYESECDTEPRPSTPGRW